MIDNSLSKEIRPDTQSRVWFKQLHVVASSVGTNSWCKKFSRVDIIKTIQNFKDFNKVATLTYVTTLNRL